MMQEKPSESTTPARRPRRAPGLSYKFQRLRERLRHAITSGELTGKLPGERELAKRFHVNAKTLSKALTDLAAEGLVERSIGRGTYVKGAFSGASPAEGRWLILAGPDERHDPVIQLLVASNPAALVSRGAPDARPSFLNQFSAVINFSPATPEAMLRDLVVRNVPVVTVGHEPRPYSTHAVLVDRTFGAVALGRELILGGHRKIATIEAPGENELLTALRMMVARSGQTVEVEPVDVQDIAGLVQHGTSAVVCGCSVNARRVFQHLERAGLAVPRDVSLGVVGPSGGGYPCTGYFVDPEQKVETILQLLGESNQRRPLSLWLVGRFMDQGTILPLAPPHPMAAPLFPDPLGNVDLPRAE